MAGSVISSQAMLARFFSPPDRPLAHTSPMTAHTSQRQCHHTLTARTSQRQPRHTLTAYSTSQPHHTLTAYSTSRRQPHHTMTACSTIVQLGCKSLRVNSADRVRNS